MTSSQIPRAAMFDPLLDADPSFLPHWRAFLAEYCDEPDLPLYLALSPLAEHLIERLGRGDTKGFNAIFDVVERWHVDGDAYVREAATIGLLESIQNQLGGNGRSYRAPNGVRATDFEPWLRPETRKWWDKLYRYWGGDPTALHPDS